MLWEFVILLAYIVGSYALISLGLKWFWREFPDKQKPKDK